MLRENLIEHIKVKKSFLCIGLDVDVEKIPKIFHNDSDPLFSFNKALIDLTQDLAVAYKPNLAFYEYYGHKGMLSLEKTMDYLPSQFFTIADAKRGDIGNTTQRYCQAYFHHLHFDCITLSPYMGLDSIAPYLNDKGKWAAVLCATSNPGFEDFQNVNLENGTPLYLEIIKKCNTIGNDENTIFVVGATRTEIIKNIRLSAPFHFFLVPGIGTQGGNLRTVCKEMMTKDCDIIVNVGRDIIYADNTSNFEKAIRKKAEMYQKEMEILLEENNVCIGK